MKQLHYFLSGFVYAFKGLRLFFQERNPRVHLVAVLVVMALAWWFEVSATEWAVLLLCIGMVLGAEALNSAIERLVDFVSPEKKHQAGEIKDIAAGAVLLVALCAAAVGLIIFGPRLLSLL